MCILVFWIEQKESATWVLSTFATFASDLIRLVCFHGNTLLSIWSFLKCHIISTIRLFRAYSSIHSNTESENLVSVKQSWTKKSMVSSTKFLFMGGGGLRAGVGRVTEHLLLNWIQAQAVKRCYYLTINVICSSSSHLAHLPLPPGRLVPTLVRSGKFPERTHFRWASTYS